MNRRFGAMLKKVVDKLTAKYSLDDIIDDLVSIEAGVLNELQQIKSKRELIAYLRKKCYLSNFDFLKVNLIDNYHTCEEDIKQLTRERDEFYENVKATDFAKQAIKDHETLPDHSQV